MNYGRPGNERITEIFGDPPRNEWERREQALIRDLHTYVFKDPRSVDAFCKLIFFYREYIAELRLLKSDCGNGDGATPT